MLGRLLIIGGERGSHRSS